MHVVVVVRDQFVDQLTRGKLIFDVLDSDLVWIISPPVDSRVKCARRREHEDGLDSLGVVAGIEHALGPTRGVTCEVELFRQVVPESRDEFLPPLDDPSLCLFWRLKSITHILKPSV